MLIFSQFTDFYYTFDSHNVYSRAKGFIISYIFPLSATFLEVYAIIKYRKHLRRALIAPLLLFTIFPILASVVQFFIRGASTTSIAICCMVVLLHIFEILDANKLVRIAHKNEIEILIEEKNKERTLISQTVAALTKAIDSKDAYTNGHSQRVADYSVKIAQAYGKSEEECEEIYLMGLLHDVGKIGIPKSIINKTGKLTDDEYTTIKKHPEIGYEILSQITVFPNLGIGARFHHERYDGKGYPTGLSGKYIPEEAAIIAVADAYDAMTSKRSYRDALPQKVVRDEIEKGIGTQFNPEFAKIMLGLIDADTEYQMKES